jgi:hypothetical protein
MKKTLHKAILLLLLSACAPGAASTPLVHVSPPGPLPSPAASAAPAPAQASPEAASPIPPTTPALSLTQAAASGLCDLGASRLNDWNSSFSPVGPWGAVLCEGDPLLTRVYRLDINVMWRLPAYTLEFAAASERAMLKPFHWSPDGKYLYLAALICCQPESTAGFEDGYSLMRLDLTSGVLVPVLGPLHQRDGFALSFSPGDRYLSYVAPGEIVLVHIVDLLKGGDNIVHLKARYWDAGRFSWSPDGRKLLITAAMPGWTTGEGGFSILLYDLPNQKLRLLVDNDLRQPAPASPQWLNEEEVPLVSLATGAQMMLNVSTQQISARAP